MLVTLLGKFGTAYPMSGTSRFIMSSIVDKYPPMIANFGMNIKNALMWSSVVFHCGSTRLLCAQFSQTNLAACSAGFASMSGAPTPAPTPVPTLVATPTAAPTVSPTLATVGTDSPTPVPLASQQYCARFTAAQTGGASGYFYMQVANGRATYSYNVNLTGMSQASSICTASPVSSGLKYHIHSDWTNMTSTSSGGPTQCGASITGGHYDPTYACSSVSQYISSTCATLQRTSSLGYTYTCNSTLYNTGDYSECEVGDLSGKFGLSIGTMGSTMFSATGVMDNTPPYIANYRNNLKNADGWSSVVFHCGSTRLVCAELTTDLSACNAALSANAPTPQPTAAPAGAPVASNQGSTTQQYCATMSPSQTSGASGYFAVQVSNGIAQYAYDVDLSSFGVNSGTCAKTLSA